MKSDGRSTDSLAPDFVEREILEPEIPESDIPEPDIPVPSLLSAGLLDFDGYAEGILGLGPGARVIMWLRGCNRRCPECIAPELWKGGDPTPIDEIASLLLEPLSRADGLTISGGEPFLQAGAVVALIDRLRRSIKTEVLVYTGYTMEELQAGPSEWKDLVSVTDILIDGPYMEKQANTLQWRGSDNQRVHLLTPEARKHNGAEDLKWPKHRPLSVQMLSPTKYRLVGIPERGDLEKLRELLRERGLEVAYRHE
jgi:anaerobic ribonucleoside-triphosphate reductase activating protein